MKTFPVLVLASAIAMVSACSSDDDDNDSSGPEEPTTVSEAGTFTVTFQNLTTNQLMTPPVVALHDPSVHLFQVGEPASDAIRDIAETGANGELVAFATDNGDVVSAAGEAGAGPFGPGGEVTINLTTDLDGQVLSAVNMVICTNDGIAGFDSMTLPADNTPVVATAVAYDAGTRDNSNDAQSFFPPPCKVGDTIPNAETSPRAGIALHPGQTVVNNNTGAPIATDNWDVVSGENVLMMTVTRN